MNTLRSDLMSIGEEQEVAGNQEGRKSSFGDDHNKNDAIVPYVCNVCNKPYKSRHLLSRHSVQHTKAKKSNVWLACQKFLAKRKEEEKSGRKKSRTTHKQQRRQTPITEKKLITRINKGRKTIREIYEVIANASNSPIDQENYLRLWQKYEAMANASNSPIGQGNDEFLECKSCGTSYTKRTEFQAHCRTHLVKLPSTPLENKKLKFQEKGKLSYLCDICDKTFIEKSIFESHWATHINSKKKKKKIFVCDACGICFSGRDAFESHSATHIKAVPEAVCTSNAEDGSLPFISSVREVLISSEKQADESGVSEKIVTEMRNSKTYCATYLDESFDSEMEAEKPFVCQTCGIRFTKSNSFQFHCCTFVKTESDDMHVSDDQTTVSTSEVHDHKISEKNSQQVITVEVLNSNKEEQKFVCETCGISFTEKDSLKSHCYTHIKIESDDVMHISDDKETLAAPDISEYWVPEKSSPHPLVSSVGDTSPPYSNKVEEQKFVCETCGISFTERDSLKSHCYTHIKIESDEVMHISDDKETFAAPDISEYWVPEKSSSHTLVSSVGDTSPPYSNKVEEQKFVCETCGISFTERDNLKSHCYTHIKIEFDDVMHISDDKETLSAPEISEYWVPEKSFPHTLISSVHGPPYSNKVEEQKFVCETCGICFTEGDSLKSHYLTHVKKESNDDISDIEDTHPYS